MKTPSPIPIIDERENLPSASGMERLYLCRGSWNLESQFTNIADKSLADSGTRIHNVLGGLAEVAILDDDEEWVYGRCKEHEVILVEQIFGLDTEGLLIIREKREWLYGEDDEKQSSGELDVIYIDETKREGLVVDYKTGYKLVTDPASNIQLREYAVLAAERYELTKVTVAVIQPRCTPPTAMAYYPKEDLDYSAKELRVVLAESNNPNAELTPGPAQCEYCRAKSICPALAKSQRFASVDMKEIVLVSPKEMDKREEYMPGWRLAEIMDKTAHFEKWCKMIRDETKLRLKAGREVPGYKLVEGRKSRSITDNYGLFKKLVHILKWVSPKDFWKLVKINVGELEKLAKKHPPKDPSVTPNRLFYKRFGEFMTATRGDVMVERTTYRAAAKPIETNVIEKMQKRQAKKLKEIPQHSGPMTIKQLFGK